MKSLIASRNATAEVVINGFNSVTTDLYRASLDEGHTDQVRNILHGIALVGVTGVSLAAGAMVLTNGSRNLYPANALLRQLVEVEFLLWKFSQDLNSAGAWLLSSRDTRQSHWKPSNIYRDQDNDYRQKDYSGHCEVGGHPTPVGARLASIGTDAPAEAIANIIGHTLIHLRDCWGHLAATVAQLLAIDPTIKLPTWDELNAEVPKQLESWCTTDLYMTTTWYFSDPID